MRIDSPTVDVLHQRVLPFYEEHGVGVDHLLTGNGREFSGRELHHPFELFLAIHQIQHRRTEVRSPEFVAVAFPPAPRLSGYLSLITDALRPCCSGQSLCRIVQMRAPVTARVLPLVGLMIPFALFAEGPAVTGVVNAMSGEPRLSPGVRARITGANFGAVATVQVGERPAAVIDRGSYWSDDGQQEELLDVQLPVELSPGPTEVVVTSGGVSSAAFRITLDAYAPGLGGILRAGFAGGGFGCKPGEQAVPGEIATAIAVGLGATNPAVPTGEAAPFAPLASTVVRPVITVGGVAAEVLESFLVPGEIGSYRITFRAPTGDGWHPVVVSIGGKESNHGNLPVGRGITVFPSARWGAGLGPGAQESIVTAITCGGGALALAPGHVTGDSQHPPAALSGVTVKVKDAAGVERPAPLFYAGPNQANFIVPAGTANGFATVTATSSEGVAFPGKLEIQNVAPSVFSTYSQYGPITAGQLLRLRGGVRTIEPVFQPGEGFVSEPVPIDPGPESDQLFLTIFGSGVRFRSSLAGVSVKIGGAETAVEYAGPQEEFPGLDQVNVRLPRSLAGRGIVRVELSVDGMLANITRLRFK